MDIAIPDRTVNIRTSITLVTGSLGSGKTTLLRHILRVLTRKIAIVMNEFGEIAIDSKVVEGKSIRIAELDGGCVCCSLLGEFEAAVNELIDTIGPEAIVVETTGVAEPDALIFDIEDVLPRARLDGVIALVDADAALRYPQLGHTTRMQMEAADTLLLNKVDLISAEALDRLKERLRQVNERAPILPVIRAEVDPDVLFGIGRERVLSPPQHIHQTEFESFTFRTNVFLNRTQFGIFADHLNRKIFRAKGFVRFQEGSYLFNYVAGRWEVEPFLEQGTLLVFIGQGIKPTIEKEVLSVLRECESL